MKKTHLINKVSPNLTCCGENVKLANCAKFLVKTDCEKCKKAHNTIGFYDNNSSKSSHTKEEYSKSIPELQVAKDFEEINEKPTKKRPAERKVIIQTPIVNNEKELKAKDRKIAILESRIQTLNHEIKHLNFIYKNSIKLTRNEIIDLDCALEIRAGTLGDLIEHNQAVIKNHNDEIIDFNNQLNDLDILCKKLNESLKLIENGK